MKKKMFFLLIGVLLFAGCVKKSAFQIEESEGMLKLIVEKAKPNEQITKKIHVEKEEYLLLETNLEDDSKIGMKISKDGTEENVIDVILEGTKSNGYSVEEGDYQVSFFAQNEVNGSLTLQVKKEEYPWIRFETKDGVEETLGYSTTVPDTFLDLSLFEYLVEEKSKMVEISYVDKTQKLPLAGAYVRKAPNDVWQGDNFSGVTMAFANKEEENGITLSSNDLYHLAEWEADGYHYSVYHQNGVSKEELLNFINGVK